MSKKEVIQRKNLREPQSHWSETQLLWEVVNELDKEIEELKKVIKNDK